MKKELPASSQIIKNKKRSNGWAKLHLICALIMGLQLLGLNSFSQDKVTLELKSTQLESILTHIEEQTFYSFIYNNDEINSLQKLDIKAFDESVRLTLDKLFQNTKIKYQVKKNFIILSRGPENSSNVKKEKFTLSGIIKDAKTGETLIGANLVTEIQNRGTVTNDYGFYSITLPARKYTFQVSYLGYRSKALELNLNANTKLDIELQPASNKLDEVIVTTDNSYKNQVKSVLSGASNLKSKDIKQLPSFFGEPDITRALLAQSGVSTVGEGASGFNVRGGNIDQNLVLLDEAPLYYSSHLWGLFSIFNADAVKDLKLYKGGIPARFGGRGSSVLEIRQKDGSNKKFKGEGGLGLLFSRLTLEGPIKKEKLSFLVSGRRSYFDIFFPLGTEEIKNNNLFYYDLNTKLRWDINQNNKLFISGYFGADVMKLKTPGEPFADGSPGPDETVDFRWKNATTSLRWNHIFSNKLFLNITGAYSNYNYTLFSQNDTGGGPLGTAKMGSFKWKSAIENWIYKSDFTFYLSPETKMRFGLNGTFYVFTPAHVSVFEEGINNVNFDVGKGLEIATYYEIEKKWNNFAINLGLRYSWFGNIGAYDISVYNPDFPKTVSTVIDTKHYNDGDVIENYSGLEPRLALKYNIAANGIFKLGYNRMFQYIHLISNTNAALPFDIWKLSGTFVKPLEANQFSLGYVYVAPNEKYHLSLESYYKTFKNIVEYKNGADLFINKNIETQLLPAKGHAYGIEFGIHKSKGKLTGDFNYTYSVSNRKTISKFSSENINGGNYFPSNYDRPNILNIATNYKLGEKWELGLFFTYQTGRPTTQPTGRFIFDGNPYLTYSDKNAYRIPNTHRLDISFTYLPRGKPEGRWKSSWNLGVYNVYSHKNAFSVFSTFHNNQLKTFQFSLVGKPIPFLTYNFKF